jgi:hypothetical protein
MAHGTVTDLVNEIMKSAPGYNWVEADGVVNVMPKKRTSGLLDLQIAHFRVTNSGPDNLRDAITALPEVKAWTAKTGVTERSIESLVSGIGEEAGPRVSIDFKGVTLRDVMNGIVKTPGLHMWSVSFYGKNDRYLSININ